MIPVLILFKLCEVIGLTNLNYGNLGISILDHLHYYIWFCSDECARYFVVRFFKAFRLATIRFYRLPV